MNLKSIMLGRALHSLLSGIGLQVAGALFGALGGGLWSLSALGHVALGAVVTGISSYVVRQTPTWLAWLAKALGAPPAASAGILVVLLAWPFVSCSPPAASGATLTVVAAGDTAKVFAHWGAVNRATSYSYSLTTLATNGTWTSLATGVSTTATSVALFPTSSTADTAVFQLCVAAVGASGSSAIGCTPSAANSANTWRRKLGSPTPILDSVTALLLVPQHDTIVIGASHTLCPFWQMGNGAVVMRSGDAAACGTAYVSSYSAAQRTVTVDQQALVDGRCLTWHNANPAVATLAVGGCDALAGRPARIPVDALAVRIS